MSQNTKIYSYEVIESYLEFLWFRHGLFKNMSQGVAQVSLMDSTLDSCGADGTFRMRRLPDREIMLNYN